MSLSLFVNKKKIEFTMDNDKEARVQNFQFLLNCMLIPKKKMGEKFTKKTSPIELICLKSSLKNKIKSLCCFTILTTITPITFFFPFSIGRTQLS